MAEGQIVVELILDDGQIIKALGNVKQQADATKKGLEEDSGGGFLSKKLGDITVGMASLGLLAHKAFDALKEGFDKSVDAARNSQKAIDDLSTALAINGKYSESAVNGFEHFASTLSKQTGVNEELITQNASLLVSLGKLSGEGLERATKAAVDFSAATGRDATVAFRLVTQAAEGNTAALHRYGIKIDENLPKSEKFALALDQINKKFGGLAAARADTFEGVLNKLSNAGDELLKAFGNLIVKSPVVRSLISLVADVIAKFAESVKEATSGKDLFGDFIKSAIPVARAINEYLVKPFEIFFRSVITGISVIATVFLGLGEIFVKVLELFDQYIAIPIADFFGKRLLDIIGVFSPALQAKLQDSLGGLGDWVQDLTKKAGEGLGDLYQTSLGETIAAANDSFETSGSAAIDGLLAKAQAAADVAKQTGDNLKVISQQNAQEIVDNTVTVGAAFNDVLDGMSGEARKFAQDGAANFKKVGASMFQALGTGAANAFAAFGKALVTGDNALKAFLNSLLASFGAALIQMGTMFILQGIAYSYAGLPNGPPLIAAGAALAVFGGVLSALGGGGGAGAGSSAGGGSGGADSGSAGQVGAQLSQPEPPRPQDKIVVNIQGDVLDSNETGSRIVKLLTDYSDKNGNGAVVT